MQRRRDQRHEDPPRGATPLDHILGEFGWIPTITMLAIGVAATWWHLRATATLMEI